MSESTKINTESNVAQVLRDGLRRRRHFRVSYEELMAMVKSSDDLAWSTYFKNNNPVKEISGWVSVDKAVRVTRIGLIFKEALALQAPLGMVENLLSVLNEFNFFSKGLPHGHRDVLKDYWLAAAQYRPADLFARVIVPKVKHERESVAIFDFLDSTRINDLFDAIGSSNLSVKHRNFLLERWLLPAGWDVGGRIVEKNNENAKHAKVLGNEAFAGELMAGTVHRNLLLGWPVNVYKLLALGKANPSLAVFEVLKSWHKEKLFHGAFNKNGYNSFADYAVGSALSSVQLTLPSDDRTLADAFVGFIAGQELLASHQLHNITKNWECNKDADFGDSSGKHVVSLFLEIAKDTSGSRTNWLIWALASQPLRETYADWNLRHLGKLSGTNWDIVNKAFKANNFSLFAVVEPDSGCSFLQKWIKCGVSVVSGLQGDKWRQSNQIGGVKTFFKILDFVAKTEPEIFFVEDREGNCAFSTLVSSQNNLGVTRKQALDLLDELLQPLKANLLHILLRGQKMLPKKEATKPAEGGLIAEIDGINQVKMTSLRPRL